MTQDIRDATITYFIVQGECIDETGKSVPRNLDTVRGMSDNGQPGWCKGAGMWFNTLADAVAATKFPYSYSCYDGHYKGGAMRVLEITKATRVVTTTKEHVL